jgi:hypothetical protein
MRYRYPGTVHTKSKREKLRWILSMKFGMQLQSAIRTNELTNNISANPKANPKARPWETHPRRPWNVKSTFWSVQHVHIINIRFDLGSFWRDFKFLTETTGCFIVVTEFPHHIHRGCLASVSRADLIDACINRTCVCTCTEKAHTCIYIWTPYPMKHHDR